MHRNSTKIGEVKIEKAKIRPFQRRVVTGLRKIKGST
jgi:hypothetical protein